LYDVRVRQALFVTERQEHGVELKPLCRVVRAAVDARARVPDPHVGVELANAEAGTSLSGRRPRASKHSDRAALAEILGKTLNDLDFVDPALALDESRQSAGCHGCSRLDEIRRIAAKLRH